MNFDLGQIMMSLENVKLFYARVATDKVFRIQIQQLERKDEGYQLAKAMGFDFTSQEFEDYTAQVLEAGAVKDELLSIDTKELAGVLGGMLGYFPLQDVQIYGSVQPDPDNSWAIW
jgi:predicted ribosomally synthesized peptide with nif11-like leader